MSAAEITKIRYTCTNCSYSFKQSSFDPPGPSRPFMGYLCTACNQPMKPEITPWCGIRCDPAVNETKTGLKERVWFFPKATTPGIGNLRQLIDKLRGELDGLEFDAGIQDYATLAARWREIKRILANAAEKL